MSDGTRHEVDVIVVRHGVQCQQAPVADGVRGRSGQLLSEVWDDDDPRAYLGIAMPGFPNLFCLYGPSTNLGHGGSIFFQAECQTRYIVSCLRELLYKQGHLEMECHEEPYLPVQRPARRGRRRAGVGPGRRVELVPQQQAPNGGQLAVAAVDYWAMTHDPDFDCWSFEPEVN